MKNTYAWRVKRTRDDATHLLRSDDAKKALDVMKNVAKNLLLGDSKVRIVVVRMGAGVNDSVHIQVQIVELRDLVLFYNLKTFL